MVSKESIGIDKNLTKDRTLNTFKMYCKWRKCGARFLDRKSRNRLNVCLCIADNVIDRDLTDFKVFQQTTSSKRCHMASCCVKLAVYVYNSMNWACTAFERVETKAEEEVDFLSSFVFAMWSYDCHLLDVFLLLHGCFSAEIY